MEKYRKPDWGQTLFQHYSKGSMMRYVRYDAHITFVLQKFCFYTEHVSEVERCDAPLNTTLNRSRPN